MIPWTGCLRDPRSHDTAQVAFDAGLLREARDHALTSGCAQLPPQIGVTAKLEDRLAQTRGIAHRHQPSRPAVFDRIAIAADCRRDRRYAVRHRLEQGIGKALLMRHQQREIGSRQDGFDIVALT